MSNVVTNRILLLTPLLLAVALLSGIFLPVYSDEIVTKFSVARFFLENGKMLSFFPQCTTTVDRDVALVFYPAAILISSIYAHMEPLGLRVSGIVLALSWFVLLAYWCFRQCKEKWSERFTMLTSIASLGVLPYLWVFSRPEQFMLVPILIFCITALYLPTQTSTWRQAAIAIALGLTASLFFYAHPKSLFFAPFFIATTWICTRSFKLAIRASLLIYIALLSVQVLRDASLLGGCQDAPTIQALLATNSLMPGTLFSDPIGFSKLAYQNILDFPGRMLLHITFNPSFQSGWLPPLTSYPTWISWLNVIIHYTMLAFMAISHLLAIGMAAIYLARRQLSAPLILAALLSSGDFINIALYNLQNFYAGIQYIPISITIVVLLFQYLPNRASSDKNPTVQLMQCFVLGLSLISMATLFYFITPNLARNAALNSAAIPGQPLSVPVFGVREHLTSIKNLGNSCHIQPNAEHLVVDHMTYFAYLKSRSPIHVLYVSEFGYGGDLINGKLLPFLKERNSPGLITRCEWVPNEFRGIQQQDKRGYCCVNFNPD